MFNGIKPTRLWYLTGRVHFLRMLNARLTADPCRVYAQRERPDLLMLHGIVFAGVTAIAYAYGLLSGPADCKKPFKAGGADKECPHSDPCPAIEQPRRPKPCPPDD